MVVRQLVLCWLCFLMKRFYGYDKIFIYAQIQTVIAVFWRFHSKFLFNFFLYSQESLKKINDLLIHVVDLGGVDIAPLGREPL